MGPIVRHQSNVTRSEVIDFAEQIISGDKVELDQNDDSRISNISHDDQDVHLNELRARNDPQMLAIGQQMKLIYDELKAYQTELKTDWTNHLRPVLISDVEEWRKKVKGCAENIGIQGNAASSKKYDLETLERFEEEYKKAEAQLENKLKALLFPRYKHRKGSGGVYFAYNDLWVALMQGIIGFDINPRGAKGPEVDICIGGKHGKGFIFDVFLSEFKLMGDVKSRIPHIKREEIRFTLEFRLTMKLKFKRDRNRWTCNRDFKLSLLNFKGMGMVGITQTLVSTLLRLYQNRLKAMILNLFSVELGIIFSKMPTTMKFRGHFSVYGLDTCILQDKLIDPQVCSGLGITMRQSLMFLEMQKAMGMKQWSKPLRRLTDYGRHIGNFRDHPLLWSNCKKLWIKSAERYSFLVNSSDKATGDTSQPLELTALMNVFDTALDQELRINLTVPFIHMKINVTSASTDFLSHAMRAAEDGIRSKMGKIKADKTSIDRTVSRVKEEIQTQQQDNLRRLSGLANNCDYGKATLLTCYTSGVTGLASVGLSNINIMAPSQVKHPLPTEMEIGRRFPVEILFSVRPTPSGIIFAEFMQVIATKHSSNLLQKDLYDGTSQGKSVVRKLDHVLEAFGERTLSSEYEKAVNEWETQKLNQISADHSAICSADPEVLRLSNLTLSDTADIFGASHDVQKDLSNMAPTQETLAENNDNRLLRIFVAAVHGIQLSLEANQDIQYRKGDALLRLEVNPASCEGADKSTNSFLVVKGHEGSKLRVKISGVHGGIDVANLSSFSLSCFDNLDHLRDYLESEKKIKTSTQVLSKTKSVVTGISGILLKEGIKMSTKLTVEVSAYFPSCSISLSSAS
jgi:hypothetical protein